MNSDLETRSESTSVDFPRLAQNSISGRAIALNEDFSNLL